MNNADTVSGRRLRRDGRVPALPGPGRGRVTRCLPDQGVPGRAVSPQQVLVSQRRGGPTPPLCMLGAGEATRTLPKAKAGMKG